ncbi:hypothetical protein L0Y65_02730 [Candidatus Micrarchaeota archaeon]|nr:hypothetical protein [Candidatus Micrarchaeota archaeon]
MKRLTKGAADGIGASPRNIRAGGAGCAFIAGAALVGALGLCACSNERDNFRCYGFGQDSLKVYVESGRRGSSELGQELALSSPKLGVEGEPLASFCTSSGHLISVNRDKVFIRRLRYANGALSVDRILESTHTAPDEYAVPGVRVVSADIWRNPDAPYDQITIATITNTGLFQAARYSLEGVASNNPDHGLFDLTRKIQVQNRWPEHDVAAASVHVLDSEMFAVVPLGERGKGAVRGFYNIVFTGKRGTPFYSREMDIRTMKLHANFPELQNVFEISEATRYDRSLGGWIINLRGERADGSDFPIFAILTP